MPRTLPALALALACMPQSPLLARLASQFQERPILAGLNADGTMLRITASPAGETWTAIIVRPDGLACIIAGGKALEPEATMPVGDPS